MAPKLFSDERRFNSHFDVLEYNSRRYTEGVQIGSIVPTVYPAFTYGLAVLILFFMIPPSSRLHNKATRYCTFAVTAAWHAWLIANCKAWGPSVSFGIGIMAAWGIVWAAVLLVFNDAKSDWKRIVREDTWTVLEVRDGKSPDPAESKDPADVTIRELKVKPMQDSVGDQQQRRRTIEEHKISYSWQPYPRTWQDRFVWTCDIVSTMRGIGWLWKISGLPSRSRIVEASLSADSPSKTRSENKAVSRNGIKRYDTYWSVIMHNVWIVIKGYIAIDILKTIVVHDPYFWGLVDRAPPTWLPYFIQASALWTRAYRLTVSMSLVWIGLRTIYSFGPLFFVGVLGKEYLGSNGEPWMYPDHYGSYLNVFTRGLAGWWGGWWHQVFRFAFQAGGHWITDDVLRLQPKTMLSNFVQLFVAFAMSGFLHASGSRTMMGKTMPLSGSFLFFLVQPIGIILEISFKNMLKKAGLLDKAPNWLAWTSNFVYVHAWFFLTGSLLTDDFARGGIWLFEPIMLSPLRGLGFGPEGTGFFCWGGRHFAWHLDQRWWLSGIAL